MGKTYKVINASRLRRSSGSVCTLKPRYKERRWIRRCHPLCDLLRSLPGFEVTVQRWKTFWNSTYQVVAAVLYVTGKHLYFYNCLKQFFPVKSLQKSNAFHLWNAKYSICFTSGFSIAFLSTQVFSLFLWNIEDFKLFALIDKCHSCVVNS